jgi:hypothetical protein
MTDAELITLGAKLTQVGLESSPPYALVLTSDQNVSGVDISQFEPFRRAGVFYLSDSYAFHIRIPLVGLSALLDSLATRPGITDGDVDSSGFLSFTLVNAVNDSTMGFESIVGISNGRDLFTLLRAASGSEARIALNDWFCSTDLLPINVVSDVSSQVSVELSGLRRESDEMFVGNVAVANNSEDFLAAPLSLVVIPSAGVTLSKPDGFTCRAQPAGRAYVDLPVGSGLAAGDTVVTAVEFRNLESGSITIQSRVYSGAGER